MPNVYQPLSVVRKEPKLPISLSREARIWATTCKRASHVFPHPVSDICFSPSRPHDLAVSFGNSISFLNQRAARVTKTIANFRDLAYSPSFKQDGSLLVGGCNDGTVKVFDVKSKSPLRALTGHQGSVQSTHFSADGLHVLSGSDDCTVRVWDIAEAKNIITLRDATEYVRAQNHSPASRHVWITGSYDHKARLYDLRTRKCIFTLDHGDRIDEVHILSGGALVVTSGGPVVRLWDLFSGGTNINSLSCHANAVTCVAVDNRQNQIMTGGLDGYIKVHDLPTLHTTGVMSLHAQILRLDLAPDGMTFAVGFADGGVEIRAAKHPPLANQGEQSVLANAAIGQDDDLLGWGRGFKRMDEDNRGPRPGTDQYTNRGSSVPAGKHDTIVMSTPKHTVKKTKVDAKLQKYEHEEAFLVAMDLNLDVVVAVVDELLNRHALVKTLQALTLGRVAQLVSMVASKVRTHLEQRKLAFLMEVVMDVHAGSLMECEQLKCAVKQLSEVIAREVSARQHLAELGGGVDMLRNVSTINLNAA